MDYFHLAVVFVSLLFSAIFSGIEIAFISSDKLQIEVQSQKRWGKILVKFIKNPSRFISTILVGNTLALVVYGIFMASLLEPILQAALPEIINNDLTLLILQTAIATLIVLITAEFTPKSIFLLNPNRLLAIFAFPMYIIYWIMWPLVYLVVSFSKFFIVRILRLEFADDQPVFGLTDLNNFIKKLDAGSQENTIEVDTKIFHNALEFKTVKVRECMIPRTEIMAVDSEDGITALKQAFIESGHSKILVYRDSIDDIIGYCSSLELFKKPKDINEILLPIIIVPETILANELMIQFINEHKSLALVVDEFGGTSGIVSIEDIIEEIFGEIQDEHDEEDLVEQQLEEGVYLLSGRHEIDYLNEKHQWQLPEGDYDTLGGFILSVTEDIPDINKIIDIPPFTFSIISKQETRIDIVKLVIADTEDEN